jgi:hypothetical protein
MGWFEDIISLPYNAVTGQQTTLQQKADLEAGITQIQGVAVAADKYYGPDVALAAQNAADQNSVQLDANLNALNAKQAADGCAGGLDLGGLGLGCISSLSDLSRWVKIALGLALAGVVVYVYVIFIAPFTRRR